MTHQIRRDAERKAALRAAARFERTGNPLATYDVLYPAAVERIATALRSRFESGELRGWKDYDGDDFPCGFRMPIWKRPPSFRIEHECGRRWIATPLRAMAVLKYSPNVEAVEPWDWQVCHGPALLGAAEAAMALDVLAFARSRGWTKRQRGEQDAKLLGRAA